jgi:hypothetical protein
MNTHPPGSALEQRAHARLTSRSSQCRADDDVDEPVPGVPQRRQLQALLGTEVREQSTLRHVRQIGEGADCHAAQADLTRRARRLVEHHVPGCLAFAHR